MSHFSSGAGTADIGALGFVFLQPLSEDFVPHLKVTSYESCEPCAGPNGVFECSSQNGTLIQDAPVMNDTACVVSPVSHKIQLKKWWPVRQAGGMQGEDKA